MDHLPLVIQRWKPWISYALMERATRSVMMKTQRVTHMRVPLPLLLPLADQHGMILVIPPPCCFPLAKLRKRMKKARTLTNVLLADDKAYFLGDVPGARVHISVIRSVKRKIEADIKGRMPVVLLSLPLPLLFPPLVDLTNLIWESPLPPVSPLVNSSLGLSKEITTGSRR